MSNFGRPPGPLSNGRQILSNPVKWPSNFPRALCQIRQIVKFGPRSGPPCQIRQIRCLRSSDETTWKRVAAMRCQSVDMTGSYTMFTARGLTESLQ